MLYQVVFSFGLLVLAAAMICEMMDWLNAPAVMVVAFALAGFSIGTGMIEVLS
ncbi:MAG: hypothetical protein LPL29_13320 [Alphaproteobacteria bacterium]|nr:hypothetical protein [Alphaproteobacteria bacterium]